MILAVCFMKINELLSGLWGAGGRQAELRAHTTHTRSSPISRWLECLPAHCLPISRPPVHALSSLCFLSAPVEAPKTLFTQLDLAISYSCVPSSLSERFSRAWLGGGSCLAIYSPSPCLVPQPALILAEGYANIMLDELKLFANQ